MAPALDRRTVDFPSFPAVFRREVSRSCHLLHAPSLVSLVRNGQTGPRLHSRRRSTDDGVGNRRRHIIGTLACMASERRNAKPSVRVWSCTMRSASTSRAITRRRRPVPHQLPRPCFGRQAHVRSWYAVGLCQLCRTLVSKLAPTWQPRMTIKSHVVFRTARVAAPRLDAALCRQNDHLRLDRRS